MSEFRDFLELSYGELEDLNLQAKEERKKRVSADVIQEERLKYLTDERRIKAVTVLFSDLEGRLHMLDYDKKFLVKSYDNLTFDGSSIRGFTAQRESDLRLGIDWGAFYWVPADVFGAGKVIVFGDVIDKNGTTYGADIRGVLKEFSQELFDKNGYTLNAANEIEGFLFEGIDAERNYHDTGSFEYVNKGGYYHSLRFENEKDHPEVAPSQFEINYSYGEVVAAADQIQLYKLICRQVATQMGMTASFLPKPVVGVNGSGMHTNVSITKGGKNLFWDPKGEEKISKMAWQFTDRILTHGNDLCLLLNARPWFGFRSAMRSLRGLRCVPLLRMRILTWCCTRYSRPDCMAKRRGSRTCGRRSGTCRTTSTRRLRTSGRRSGRRRCWVRM